MKITIFTSNHPRHLALIERIQEICDELYVAIECKTLFPGAIEDVERKSSIMENYFSKVIEAENSIFGQPRFIGKNINILNMKAGDLSHLSKDVLFKAMESDYYIIFGASYIRGWLIDFLIANRAINVHMGVSPYYRGSSSNFWPMYDKNPLLVGSTIHLLSRGLDTGDILFHAMPLPHGHTAFEYSMSAVLAAQIALTQHISNGKISSFPRTPQMKSVEIRYTRHADFTDKVASEFLLRDHSNQELIRQVQSSQKPVLINPFYY